MLLSFTYTRSQMTFQTNIQDQSGKPVSGALVTASVETTGQCFQRFTDGNGYADLALINVPVGLPLTFSVIANGFQLLAGYLESPAADSALHITLVPSFKQPLESLAQIRGAMWTARLDVPFGPRPGLPDNVVCIDYFECFPEATQDRIIAAYRGERGYTHAPLGPIVDPGYHGQLPATDWRAPSDFSSVYLDAALKLRRGGIEAIHFLRPDRGVAGLDWTVEDLNHHLTPLFATQKAQSTMRIVCLGWEPGPRYRYDNAWWVEMCRWMADTFPHALRLIHMVNDIDAPVGGDDDQKGITNGQGWFNVAPYLHGWLVQNAGYTSGPSPTATPEFVTGFTEQFRANLRGSLIERFTTGGPPGDWPTSSAWGPGKRLKVYAGEYAAFADYWENWPEAESRRLGQLALAAGADGAFDGC